MCSILKLELGALQLQGLISEEVFNAQRALPCEEFFLSSLRSMGRKKLHFTDSVSTVGVKSAASVQFPQP